MKDKEIIKEMKNVEGFNAISKVLKKKPRKTHLSSEKAKEMSEKGKKTGKQGKHGKRKRTLLLEEVQKEIQRRLVERSLKLIDTQTVIAHGTIKVFKITYSMIGKKKVRNPPELVTNDEEIASAIAYEYSDGECPNTDDEYFFISTVAPDGKAIESQLNRLLGKAPQSIDLTTKGKEFKNIIGMRILKEPEDEAEEEPIK